MVSRAHDGELQLLTVQKAAELLSCSIANVYALIESGDLPVVQVGHRKGYRIDAQDLAAFVANRKFRFESPPKRTTRISLKHLRT